MEEAKTQTAVFSSSVEAILELASEDFLVMVALVGYVEVCGQEAHPGIWWVFPKPHMMTWKWFASRGIDRFNEMRDWLGSHYTSQEVREIHTDRMSDLAAMQAQLNEVAYADRMHGPTRIAALKAKVQVHAMHDQIMRQAGYYRAFDISKQNTPGQEQVVTINADFIRDIETLTMGGDPLIEYYGEEEDGRGEDGDAQRDG